MCWDHIQKHLYAKPKINTFFIKIWNSLASLFSLYLVFHYVYDCFLNQELMVWVLQVAFPNFESLLISHMPNPKIIWHDKLAPGSFTKLQSMNVQFCESLMNIFQVNMLSRFQSLESLVVDDCDSLQEIFELEGQEVTEARAVTMTQLKKLFMRRLPKLKCVWNKDP